jgi:hypothetical protein
LFASGIIQAFFGMHQLSDSGLELFDLVGATVAACVTTSIASLRPSEDTQMHVGREPRHDMREYSMKSPSLSTGYAFATHALGHVVKGWSNGESTPDTCTVERMLLASGQRAFLFSPCERPLLQMPTCVAA